MGRASREKRERRDARDGRTRVLALGPASFDFPVMRTREDRLAHLFEDFTAGVTPADRATLATYRSWYNGPGDTTVTITGPGQATINGKLVDVPAGCTLEIKGQTARVVEFPGWLNPAWVYTWNHVRYRVRQRQSRAAIRSIAALSEADIYWVDDAEISKRECDAISATPEFQVTHDALAEGLDLTEYLDSIDTSKERKPL